MWFHGGGAWHLQNYLVRLFKTLIESFALHIPDRFLCVKAEISPYLQANKVNLPQVHIHFWQIHNLWVRDGLLQQSFSFLPAKTKFSCGCCCKPGPPLDTHRNWPCDSFSHHTPDASVSQLCCTFSFLMPFPFLKFCFGSAKTNERCYHFTSIWQT